MTDLHERMEEYLLGKNRNARAYEDWDPPDGKHTALILDYKEGIGKKGAWWALVCKCLDPEPELTDKVFRIWYREAVLGILKSAVSTLAGHKVEPIKEAILTLMESVGKTINIQTKTNEKGYTNHRILGVVTKAPEAPKVSQMSTKD